MRHFKNIARALVLLALTTLISHASATSVLWADMETLGEKAHLVVTGTVVSATVVEREDAAAFQIYTDYVVQVDAVHKGDSEPLTVTLRLPGGTLPNGTTTRVEGMPELALEGRYLLLLWGLDGARYGESPDLTYYVPLGLQQGVWALDENEIATRDLSHVALFLPGGQPAPKTGLEQLPLPRVLDALAL